MAGDGGTDPMPPQADHFRPFDANLKGTIADENGLDVLYWRNLEAGSKRLSFKRQYYRNLRDDRKEDVRRNGDVGRKKEEPPPPVQEAPPQKGSWTASPDPVWGEKNDQRMKKAPTFTPDIASKEDDEDQDSSVPPFKTSTPPPPGAQFVPFLQPALASSAVPKGELTPPLPLPPPMRLPLASGSIPKGKMPAPPRPPPSALPNKGPAVPPPPPPSALPNKGPAAPPPPPPSALPNKGPATPPPPPPAALPKTAAPPPPPPSSTRGLAPSATPPVPEGMMGNNANSQVKMKPLHWDKMSTDPDHSMVWDKMNQGSFKFDGDIMEALFGYVASNRKSPRAEHGSTDPNTNKSGQPSQIFILDTRKSQNIAIVIKSLGVTRRDLIHALLEAQGLESDTLEKLVNMTPSKEELSQILAFRGDPTRLADAESFLYHLLKAVPTAFLRFKALLFKANYDTEVSHIKESLTLVESACKELKTRALFLKLLEAVLKAGNQLNAGTARGNAQAFDLTALTKLSDVKSCDGKTTLLQFIVQEVVRAEGKRVKLGRNQATGVTNSDESMSKEDRDRECILLGLPVVGGLSGEFSNVKRAAGVEYEVLLRTSSALATELDEARKIVHRYGNEGGFAREMIGFLDTAELEIQKVAEDRTRVIELVKKTTDYYQTGFSSKDRGRNTFQLFVIVRDFLAMVDQACVDIKRNMQTRKPVSAASLSSGAAGGSGGGGSSAPESPRIFRFPKLPVDFMLQDSKSGSVDFDDDSEFG